MGYVYKFTHKITGKWYIGSHNGNKPNYTGSGLLWKRAKDKYGIESFIKEILYVGENFRAEEERILIELDAANDCMSYNMKNQALGGIFLGEKNGMYGKKLTEEHRIKCGNAYRDKKDQNIVKQSPVKIMEDILTVKKQKNIYYTKKHKEIKF